MKYIPIAIVFIMFTSCNLSKKIGKKDNVLDYDIEFINYLFKDYQAERPSASVIVIKDGEIAFTKSYGYADIENKTIATPNTNYRIASVTKQFTAMAIMILVHQGKLTYETSLTDVFPKFPDYGKGITIRHLLTHRSGLVNYNRFIEEGRTEQMLDKDVLNGLFETDSTYFLPGAKYAYSNTGYAVLAQVIEKISGDFFSDFMMREIFLPLNMTNSTILEAEKEIKNRAYGYIIKDSTITAKDQSMTSAIQGDGGVYTSVLDYYRWDKALYADMLIPQSELNDAFYNYDEDGKSNDKGYGYGWMVDYYNGIKILQHGGSSTGFGSHVIRIPGERISVAIFTNRNKGGSELSIKADALISHFSNGKFPMPFEVVVGRKIDENGIQNGLKLYNTIKSDTLNYSILKESLFYFAISYINSNRNSDAFKLFEQLIQDYPSFFGGYYGKAIILKEQNKKQEAIEYFKKTIKSCTELERWAIGQSNKMIKELEK
jgi:CubicO group peptidase (beta-lactamase class C family)